jgi:hypothetical protein
VANSRFALAENRALTAEERRQHLLAVHDSVAAEIGGLGTLDRMALRMALDLYARSLESTDLIAGARALAEFIRSMGRLKLLDSLRRAGGGSAATVSGRKSVLWQGGQPRKRRASAAVEDVMQEQDEAGAVGPDGEANDDAADSAAGGGE